MADLGARIPPKLNALTLAAAEDPYPTYAALRERGPLCRGEFGQWVVTRYAEVAALLRDPRLGSELPIEYPQLALGDSPVGDFLRTIVLSRDPPAHTRLRRVMSKEFGTTAVRGLRGHIGDLTDRLLAPALDRGEFDAVTDLGLPLPVLVVCELLGIPEADREHIWPQANALAQAIGAVRIPPEQLAGSDAALRWLRDYLGALLDERRGTPRGDQLSQMLAPDEDGQVLAHDIIVDNVIFLLHAGFETTIGLISNGCAALLRHPDELARLRADPSRMPMAIEEFLRYDAPIQVLMRLAEQEIVVGEHKVRKGRALFLLVGSANRDERGFAFPDRLDLTRRPNPHLSFGGGTHHCLGVALARLTGEVVFDRLIRRFAGLDLGGEAVRRPHASIRAFAHLPISVRAT